MSCPFTVMCLIDRARNIEGFELIKGGQVLLFDCAVDTSDLYEDWPKGQGFSSSDMTCATKDCLDAMIGFTGQHLLTVFDPNLKVIKI